MYSSRFQTGCFKIRGKEPMKDTNYKKKHISRIAKNYSLCLKKKTLRRDLGEKKEGVG